MLSWFIKYIRKGDHELYLEINSMNIAWNFTANKPAGDITCLLSGEETFRKTVFLKIIDGLTVEFVQYSFLSRLSNLNTEKLQNRPSIWVTMNFDD